MDGRQGQSGSYDPWRRAERLFWPAMFFGSAMLNGTADYQRDRRDGIEVSLWDPLVREFISASVLLVLVWLILGINKRWKLRRIGKIRYFTLHAALSWPFAFIHVVFAAVLVSLPPVITGEAMINWSFIVSAVATEYPKDAILYLMIITITNVYGWARRAVGPQDSVDIGEFEVKVRTRTGMRFLKLDEIDWIEAARNYVILHAAEREYFLRTTMGEIEARFVDRNFRRVHRSAILNLGKLKEIKRSGRQSHEAVLTSGARVRLGRKQAAELLRE